MKTIMNSLRSAFAARRPFTATMIIAGITLTRTILARDPEEAKRIAEIIIDDCGFLVDLK